MTEIRKKSIFEFNHINKDLSISLLREINITTKNSGAINKPSNTSNE